ncbi:protein of unknown function DUF1028 [Candidatus Magnetoovum chiemensis]|nr:protein of unknown function DUF1028 [Candidatus Magnetoovum chiemensis]
MSTINDNMELPKTPVCSYSILAKDKDTEHIGALIVSHYFSVGSIALYAKSGVGIVITQSFPDDLYGANGLDMMRSGVNAKEALTRLLSKDRHSQYRQVAMMDASGEIAVHTGKLCVSEAGHEIGDGYAVCANMMMNKSIWNDMGIAYKTASGDLTDRLVSAIDTGNKRSEEVRMGSSAAFIVISAKSSGNILEDKIFDLRVDDNSAPLKELKRLISLNRAYRHRALGDAYLAQNNIEAALEEYERAKTFVPNNTEFMFWTAVCLVNAGRIDDAMGLFKQVFERDIKWSLLAVRLARSKLLPPDPELIQRIISISTRS